MTLPVIGIPEANEDLLEARHGSSECGSGALPVWHLDIALREELAVISRDAEGAMYKATRGSNANQGAIRILGLLVAAAAIPITNR